jgi:NAD(P)-dependent dehydrogenase (short-subunit alcohol dehydrogenase family)
MRKTAIVTGGSSGIGRAAAAELAGAGYTVYELSRREPEEPVNGVKHIGADVTDEEQVRSAFESIAAKEGSIDLLVCCAGTGISGALEFTKVSEARRQVDVNFFGTYISAKAVIPYMRKQGGGRIINISSVAACVPIPFQIFYSVTKAGINSLTLALANELRTFNISVCALMPGDTRTGFTAARVKEQEGDSEYGGAISRSVTRMEKDEQNGGSPEAIGKIILKLAQKKRVKPLYTAGFQYKLFVMLSRLLPLRLSNWIIGLIYAS